MAKPGDFFDVRAAHPKGEARKKTKGRKSRTESKILHMIRMHDVARDGHCRYAQDIAAIVESVFVARRYCDGESELAHLENQRRFKTRGMKPELRHTTAGTCMLCKRHHTLYDARKLRVKLLSNAGADGELRWGFAW